FQPDSLSLMMRLFVFTFRAAKDQEANCANQLINRATINLSRPLLKQGYASTRSLLFQISLGDALVEIRAYVVAVQKKVEREHAKNARDFQGTKPAAPSTC